MAAPFSWSFTTALAGSSTFTLWSNSVTPANPSASDTGAVEVGVKFRSDVAGYITGVRFYKGSGNTGTHVGNLWTSTGDLLATATFSGETTTGWQQVSFASPVAIAANTTYVASYYAPTGHYAYNSAYFATSGVTSGPLHALANGVDGGDGVYVYGTSNTFPTASFNSTNYWVDVVFTTTAPAGTAPATMLAAPTTTVARANDDEPERSERRPIEPATLADRADGPGFEFVGVGPRRQATVHVAGPRRGPGRDLGDGQLESRPAARRDTGRRDQKRQYADAQQVLVGVVGGRQRWDGLEPARTLPPIPRESEVGEPAIDADSVRHRDYIGGE